MSGWLMKPIPKKSNTSRSFNSAPFQMSLTVGKPHCSRAAAAAAGTVAELGATGLDALNALAVNLGDAADLEAGLVADALVGDELARKGALDEDDLAVVMTHAAAFLVEALHLDGEVFGGFLFASCHDS